MIWQCGLVRPRSARWWWNDENIVVVDIALVRVRSILCGFRRAFIFSVFRRATPVPSFFEYHQFVSLWESVVACAGVRRVAVWAHSVARSQYKQKTKEKRNMHVGVGNSGAYSRALQKRSHLRHIDAQ